MATCNCTSQLHRKSVLSNSYRGFLVGLFLLALMVLPLTGRAQLANTPWPKYLGNVLNTSLGLGQGTSSTVQWTYAAQAPIYTAPVIGADGTIYFGSDDSNVYAIDGKTGLLKWSYATLSYVESSPAIGSDGTIYIGGDDANIYALNGATGALKWSFTTGSFIDSSPAIGTDGTVYVGSTDGNVYALNGQTGAVIWTFPTQGSVESSASIGSDGTVYIGSDDGNLYAIVGSTGVQKWAYNIGLAVYNAPSIGPDGTVFIGEDMVYAINPATGNNVWAPLAMSDDITTPISISSNETLYMGTADGQVESANGTTGVAVATYQYQAVPGFYEAAPIIAADGTVYAASDGGVISALSPSLQSLWNYTATNDQFGATPAIGKDGTLYIGALSGSLYAFEPVVLTSLTLSATSVASGDSSVTGTLNLNVPAPGNNLTVNLTSDSPYVSVPSTVYFSANATSASFPLTVSYVGANSIAHVTASYQGLSFTVPITVTPTTLANVSFNPSTVAGGVVATGTVTLNGPAPSGGTQVNLSSSSPTYAKVPTWAIVQEGSTTATFSVTTIPVTTAHTVVVTGSFGKVTQTTTLTVDPALVQKVTVNPTSVPGGITSTGSVSLTGPATAGGIQVKLKSSSTTEATVPATVTIPAKSQSATFVIHTSAVSSTSTPVITASVGTSSETATLTITPASLSSVTIVPHSLVGGASATGTVTLTGPAATGGAKVTLSSSVSSATVASSVTVPAGRSSVTFPIKTLAVGVNTNATITGTFNTVPATGILTITAPTLTSLTLAPASVASGKTAVGTVHISSAAPVGGLVITLTSANSNATVPGTVTILAGKTSATFTVTAAKVTAKTTVTLSSALNGTTKTAVLTIL